jgi:hypothetical protein
MQKLIPASIITFSLINIAFLFLASCSANSQVELVENRLSPPTLTAQAIRAVARATQSGERVKATFSQQYADANATEESLENYYAERKNWPLILKETFDDNRNEWQLEEVNGDLASVSWKIENGKYQWDTHANEGFIYWTYPSLEPTTDFILSVDAQQIKGPQDGQYGLIFRLLDESNYYLFIIDQNKNYIFQLYKQGEWITIANGNISPVLMQNGINRISVIGEKENFHFYINDVFINEETDYSLSSGRSGIAVGLTYPEDQAIFEFDNFELRSPENTGDSE